MLKVSVMRLTWWWGGAVGLVAFHMAVAAERHSVPPEIRLGERLFFEAGFSRPAVAGSGWAAAPSSVSCATCHEPPGRSGEGVGPELNRAFCDSLARSAIPDRGDGQLTTPRNSPALIGAFGGGEAAPVFHFDGEFATPEQLVAETYLGRNFGWLPAERAEALRHFSKVIRESRGPVVSALASADLGYAVLFGATDAVPIEWRLPAAYRLDVARANDEEVLAAAARLVVTFVRSLQFSRDASGAYNGSPYDAFLTLNRLPRTPAIGETPHEYARRLSETVAALRAPKYVDEPSRRLRLHDQPFRFQALELQGMRIFFRSAIGVAQASGAGNCAECHVPPHFSDFRFHNTGVAQDEYDAVHGAGAFLKLKFPTAAERDADYDRWLQPTSRYPEARGTLRSPIALAQPGRADLGLWNVYGNPELPDVQPAIERLLNANGQLSRDAVLERCVARFKTSGLRSLGQSAPYFHTGRAESLEAVIRTYRDLSELARAGRMRNAPPEFFSIRLSDEDVAPLVAFLRALNEDATGAAQP